MEILIQNLSNCFSDTEKPILIFCNWNDALAIQENLVTLSEKVVGASFERGNKLFGLNCFSCFIKGKDFYFIDQNQTEQFLLLINNKS